MRTVLFALFFTCIAASPSFGQTIAPDSLNVQIRRAANMVEQGEQDSGTRQLLDLLATAQRENLPKSEGIAYYYLAYTADRLQDASGTMRYARLSQNAYEKAGDAPAGIGGALLWQLIAHSRTKHFDSALVCGQRAAEFFKIAKDSVRLAQANVKIGNIIEMSGKFEEATPYYMAYFRFAEARRDSVALGFAHTYLAYNFYLRKEFQTALHHAEAVLTLFPKEKMPFDHGVALQYLSGIHEGLGDYKTALDFERQYSSLRDSNITRERSKQVAEMEARFQNSQKQAEIALLEKDKSRQQTIIWASLALLGVLLAATVLIFRANQTKTAANRALAKANQILAAQKTEIEAKNQQNELLLKEIHHRVKNNLQVVSTLLDLQAQHVSDDAALDALREGQNRVESMGLIHQKLYQGNNLTGIEMHEYLQNLTDFLLASFGKNRQTLRVELDVPPLILDVDTAVPLGLIANELITNALKYAFCGEQPGVLSIRLLETPSATVLLSVSDTGAGGMIKEKMNLSRGTGFGSQLVKLLSQKLGGALETKSSETGTHVVIEFKKYKKGINYA